MRITHIYLRFIIIIYVKSLIDRLSFRKIIESKNNFKTILFAVMFTNKSVQFCIREKLRQQTVLV